MGQPHLIFKPSKEALPCTMTLFILHSTDNMSQQQQTLCTPPSFRAGTHSWKFYSKCHVARRIQHGGIFLNWHSTSHLRTTYNGCRIAVSSSVLDAWSHLYPAAGPAMQYILKSNTLLAVACGHPMFSSCMPLQLYFVQYTAR